MANVPISIDWATIATWEGRNRSNKLSSTAMATAIECCVKALDQLGDISDFVQAVKIIPQVSHGLSKRKDRCTFDYCFYYCRITFAREGGKDEMVVDIGIHFHRRPVKLGDEPPSPEEEFIASFVSQVTEKVREYQKLLQERSVSWGNLLATPALSST
jgi:hypothetical protein